MMLPQHGQPVAAECGHWLVITLFGKASTAAPLFNRLDLLLKSGFGVVLVDNNPDSAVSTFHPYHNLSQHRYRWVSNGNVGGIAGGFNRGVATAIEAGASVITLLDQDSIIDEHSLRWLRELLVGHHDVCLLVGPRIWDQRRACWHQHVKRRWHGYPCTRLLISSGTTFAVTHWHLLGQFDEALFIDFVDHAWCFRAQAAGFVLLQHPWARLEQQFGRRHPNCLCRWLGLELYTPQRHYTSLRNLRWLVRQWWVPWDLRCKEIAKMLLKPLLWFLFEPQRRANVDAVVAALRAPLPRVVEMDHGLIQRHNCKSRW